MEGREFSTQVAPIGRPCELRIECQFESTPHANTRTHAKAKVRMINPLTLSSVPTQSTRLFAPGSIVTTLSVLSPSCPIETTFTESAGSEDDVEGNDT